VIRAAQSKHPYPAPRNLATHQQRANYKEGNRGKTEKGKTNKGAPLLADFARSGNSRRWPTKGLRHSTQTESSRVPVPSGTPESIPALPAPGWRNPNRKRAPEGCLKQHQLIDSTSGGLLSLETAVDPAALSCQAKSFHIPLTHSPESEFALGPSRAFTLKLLK
jgi:hypothetical protein